MADIEEPPETGRVLSLETRDVFFFHSKDNVVTRDPSLISHHVSVVNTARYLSLKNGIRETKVFPSGMDDTTRVLCVVDGSEKQFVVLSNELIIGIVVDILKNDSNGDPLPSGLRTISCKVVGTVTERSGLALEVSRLSYGRELHVRWNRGLYSQLDLMTTASRCMTLWPDPVNGTENDVFRDEMAVEIVKELGRGLPQEAKNWLIGEVRSALLLRVLKPNTANFVRCLAQLSLPVSKFSVCYNFSVLTP